jgi:hypothetical protein
MVDEFGNSETPDHTIEEIDDFIKFNDVGGTFLTEETLTPIKPKDETIYDLNNGTIPFSSAGIEDRVDLCLDIRKENLLASALEADEEELTEIRKKLDIVNEKIDKDKVHDRFEILDL